MKRITKIICTLGPACDDASIMAEMNKEGMDVARLNMSHGTLESHQGLIDKLQPLRDAGKVKLMIDTKGPEIRISTFRNGSVMLVEGDKFTFTSRAVEGDEKVVGLRYPQLVNEVKAGDKIYANNGMMIFEVEKVTRTDIHCRVLFGGKLSDHKGLNVPGLVPSTPYISEADKIDIKFAIKNHADFLAISFVSNRQNVLDIRKFLAENGGENIQIISKIENASGVKHAEEILDVSDGLMVARGDLGVEIPLEKIPPIQKKLISLCNVKKKTCVVATEMLESMTNSTRPTRAEVNDVANAIYDEATATMLSGETASGIDPVNVVRTMANIIKESEKHIYGVKVAL